MRGRASANDPRRGGPWSARFSSYRRTDAEARADRLYERLTARLQATEIFMDIDGNIPLGLPWAKWLDSQVSACDLMLVLIGRSWVAQLQARASPGERDYVRVEIESALARKIPRFNAVQQLEQI